MGLNLTKGQKIDLVKKGESLGKLLVGLGWKDARSSQSGGFLKKLMASFTQEEFDLDASVYMLESGDKLKFANDLIYFGNLDSDCRSVMHKGDNLVGGSGNDDEQVIVSLSTIPERIQKLIFVVNIYEAAKRKQHFGQVKDCYIRVYDESNRKELVRFNITDSHQGRTALIAGEVVRENGDWKFVAVGEGTNDLTLGDMNRRYT